MTLDVCVLPMQYRNRVGTCLGHQHFRQLHHLPRTRLELQHCRHLLLHPFQAFSQPHQHISHPFCLPTVLQERALELLDQGVQMAMLYQVLPVEAFFHLLSLHLLLNLHQVMVVVSPKVQLCCKGNHTVTNLSAALSLQAMFNLTTTISPLGTVSL